MMFIPPGFAERGGEGKRGGGKDREGKWEREKRSLAKKSQKEVKWERGEREVVERESGRRRGLSISRSTGFPKNSSLSPSSSPNEKSS
jgi:hypothetical protein